MIVKNREIYKCECEKCGHKWLARDFGLPKLCPNCKTKYWHERKEKLENLKRRQK